MSRTCTVNRHIDNLVKTVQTRLTCPQRPLPFRTRRDGIVVRVTLKSGSTYLSETDPRLTFGLGDSTRVDRLEVRWPSGAVQITG